ncbi:hypothetical protein MATL_G00200300 [Megalops atlanticus]|uniref:Protein LBH n=1 Tax=Megalops atlanticus TaxID=7932 RepID=A0A9D3PK13_MEGAT|nr:hypothetical protein MATL_G00200300 [Megalops atlanticus]
MGHAPHYKYPDLPRCPERGILVIGVRPQFRLVRRSITPICTCSFVLEVSINSLRVSAGSPVHSEGRSFRGQNRLHQEAVILTNCRCRFMSVYYPQVSRSSSSSVFAAGQEMTQVIVEDLRLGAREDQPSYQIFPDASDLDRCCVLAERLPAIVVEPTEGEVESGELRWPPRRRRRRRGRLGSQFRAPNTDHSSQAYTWTDAHKHAQRPLCV